MQLVLTYDIRDKAQRVTGNQWVPNKRTTSDLLAQLQGSDFDDCGRNHPRITDFRGPFVLRSLVGHPQERHIKAT